jgi:hypothetical protein
MAAVVAVLIALFVVAASIALFLWPRRRLHQNQREQEVSHSRPPVAVPPPILVPTNSIGSDRSTGEVPTGAAAAAAAAGAKQQQQHRQNKLSLL